MLLASLCTSFAKSHMDIMLLEFVHAGPGYSSTGLVDEKCARVPFYSLLLSDVIVRLREIGSTLHGSAGGQPFLLFSKEAPGVHKYLQRSRGLRITICSTLFRLVPCGF